jgi:hypothetical protein
LPAKVPLPPPRAPRTANSAGEIPPAAKAHEAAVHRHTRPGKAAAAAHPQTPPREAALPAKVPLPPPRAPRTANSAEIPLPPPRPMRSGAASPPARNAPDGQSASTVPPSPEIEHRSVSPYGELVPVTPVEWRLPVISDDQKPCSLILMWFQTGTGRTGRIICFDVEVIAATAPVPRIYANYQWLEIRCGSSARDRRAVQMQALRIESRNHEENSRSLDY